MFRLLLISGLLFFLGYGIFSFLARHLGGYRKNQNKQRPNETAKEDNKRFTKDIGEYVNYEEVKDEDK